MTFFDIFSKKKEKKLEKAKIVVDNRERNSLVVSQLISFGHNLVFEQLTVGDYIVNDVVIERKTIQDFKASIVDKRLVSQLTNLKKYSKSFLILEGFKEEDIYSGSIHENAFRGFLLSVILKYKVPIVFTQNSEDSARYISLLANKKEKREVSIRASKTLMTKEERVRFILEGFPGIGPVSAKELIKSFGSLRKIINASEEDLKKVLGKKAEIFKSILD